MDSDGDGNLEGGNGLGAQEANHKEGHDVEDSSSSIDIVDETDATSLKDMDFTTPVGGSSNVSNGKHTNSGHSNSSVDAASSPSPPLPSPSLATPTKGKR